MLQLYVGSPSVVSYFTYEKLKSERRGSEVDHPTGLGPDPTWPFRLNRLPHCLTLSLPHSRSFAFRLNLSLSLSLRDLTSLSLSKKKTSDLSRSSSSSQPLRVCYIGIDILLERSSLDRSISPSFSFSYRFWQNEDEYQRFYCFSVIFISKIS